MEPQIQQPSVEKHPVHQITPLSEYLALSLFIILPFLGGWIGYSLAPEKVVEVDKVIIVEKESTDPTTPSMTALNTNEGLAPNFSWLLATIASKDSSARPTYDVTLSIGTGEEFRIDDYISSLQGDDKVQLYGCRTEWQSTGGRPEGTLPPVNSLSDLLCYGVAGGSLFYVVQNGDAYELFHKVVGDLPEQEKISTKLLAF